MTLLLREGFPDRRTVDYWTGGEKQERYPQSRFANSHNKADGFERRLEVRNAPRPRPSGN